MGMLCARFKKFPKTKFEGNGNLELVAFTSVHSHYTIKRGAFMMGIGMNNVVNVGVKEDGRMDVDALEKAIQKSIQEGKTPFMVNATSGTTVLGVFDPIDEISKVCKKYDIWLHVDAALGGAVLFSKKYKHHMKGVELADSVCWCFHKMLGMNQQASIFLSQHENILKQTNASNADYLFHEHDETPFDLGEKTLNCGRRQDSLKIWLSWKVHGLSGFEYRVDKNYETTLLFVKEIKKKDKINFNYYLNQIAFKFVSIIFQNVLEICLHQKKEMRHWEF